MTLNNGLIFHGIFTKRTANQHCTETCTGTGTGTGTGEEQEEAAASALDEDEDEAAIGITS